MSDLTDIVFTILNYLFDLSYKLTGVSGVNCIYIYIYIFSRWGVGGSVGQPKVSKPEVPGSTPGSS